MKKLFIYVFILHALVSVFTYYYFINDPADSALYWLLNYDVNQYNWFDFFGVGSQFMVFLNYPLLKLGVSFYSGHIIYSLIGFFGIYLFAKWALEVLEVKSSSFLILIIIAFILSSPNLHVWTSFIGKEAIVFWSLSALFYTSLSIKKRWALSVVATFLLVMIRPHVAFMLLSAAIIVFLIDRSLSFKIRGLVFVGAIIVGYGLFYLMLEISNIHYLDWDRIQHFNAFSVLSLKESSGYVPMLDYNYAYKIFSLNFRPLFYDAYHTMTFLASLENLISLLFVTLSLFLSIKHFKTLVFTRWIKVSFFFLTVASVLYVERYSNLGLFMRTKMMYMPFLYVAMTSIIFQTIEIEKR